MIDRNRANLDALRDKFADMLGKRRRVEAGAEIPADELRALARRFPGALRELEMTPTDELQRRHDACASTRAPVPVWARAQSRYHALWAAAIGLKSNPVPSTAGRAEVAPMRALRLRVAESSGRAPLNGWILAHAGAAFAWAPGRVRALFDGSARVREVMPDDDRVRAMGLCAECRHRSTIGSARGSQFHLCTRSKADSSWSKYPPLPQIVCAGFDEADG